MGLVYTSQKGGHKSGLHEIQKMKQGSGLHEIQKKKKKRRQGSGLHELTSEEKYLSISISTAGAHILTKKKH